eukprot:2993726-Lingulodinium_polyedra.AAC.1
MIPGNAGHPNRRQHATDLPPTRNRDPPLGHPSLPIHTCYQRVTNALPTRYQTVANAIALPTYHQH